MIDLQPDGYQAAYKPVDGKGTSWLETQVSAELARMAARADEGENEVFEDDDNEFDFADEADADEAEEGEAEEEEGEEEQG